MTENVSLDFVTNCSIVQWISNPDLMDDRFFAKQFLGSIMKVIPYIEMATYEWLLWMLIALILTALI